MGKEQSQTKRKGKSPGRIKKKGEVEPEKRKVRPLVFVKKTHPGKKGGGGE